MHLEEAIYRQLNGNAALVAQVGGRFHREELPQNSALPAIVYSLISSIPADQAHDGPAGVESRIQISCLAATFLDAKVTAVKVKQALRPFEKEPGLMGGTDGLRVAGCFLDNEMSLREFDEVEQASRTHRPLDYIFLHEEDF